MRESSTYQEILEEGRVEGRAEGREEGERREARRMVLRAGLRRLGTLTPVVEARVNAIESLTVLEALHDRLFDVESWEDLLRDLTTIDG